MSLQIHFECPQCHQILPLNLQDFSPGHSHNCKTCQIPGRITKAGLERFSRDVRRYCQGNSHLAAGPRPFQP